MSHLQDTIKSGITAGLLGTLADSAVHWSLFFILGTTTTAHYIYQLIFPFAEPTMTRLLIGVLVHFVAGALVGVVLLLLYKQFGWDAPYYKGIELGVALWVVHIAVIPNIVSPRPFLFRSVLETVVDLIAHIVYGFIAVVYLKRSSRTTRTIS